MNCISGTFLVSNCSAVWMFHFQTFGLKSWVVRVTKKVISFQVVYSSLIQNIGPQHVDIFCVYIFISCTNEEWWLYVRIQASLYLCHSLGNCAVYDEKLGVFLIILTFYTSVFQGENFFQHSKGYFALCLYLDASRVVYFLDCSLLWNVERQLLFDFPQYTFITLKF